VTTGQLRYENGECLLADICSADIGCYTYNYSSHVYRPAQKYVALNISLG